MKTQEEWLAEADALSEGVSLEFQGMGFDLVLCDTGQIVGESVDFLTRAIQKKLGLRSYGISAPEWTCAWTSRLRTEGSEERPGFVFGYWSLGPYQVGVFLKDHDHAGFDCTFILPDMPYHEWEDPKKGSTPEERRAWLATQQRKRDFLDLLALHHFACHVFKEKTDEST